MNHSPINAPEIRSDIDKIYSAVMADTDALEDAKMALEVIKETDPGVYDEMINDTLSSINYALSNSILSAVDRLADPDQEPVAWMHTSAVGNVYFRKKPQDKVFNPQPVYLAPPPQREWVSLTAEELQEISDFHFHGAFSGREIYEDIETKLKEKNSG